MSRHVRPTRAIAVAVAAVVFLTGAPRASAETIDITLTNSGTSVTFKEDGHSMTVGGGPFHWNQSTPMNSHFESSITTYCIDLDQSISKGHTYTYTVQDDLKLAPTIGNDGTKIGAVTELFDRYYKASLASATNAAAFQLALWELVYDGGWSKNLKSGHIQAKNTQAQGMLSSLGTAYSNHDLAGYRLTALLSSCDQDQITVVKDCPPPPYCPPPVNGVPAPPGLVLAGMGFGCMLLGRFRIRRS